VFVGNVNLSVKYLSSKLQVFNDDNYGITSLSRNTDPALLYVGLFNVIIIIIIIIITLFAKT